MVLRGGERDVEVTGRWKQNGGGTVRERQRCTEETCAEIMSKDERKWKCGER